MFLCMFSNTSMSPATCNHRSLTAINSLERKSQDLVLSLAIDKEIV